MLLLVQAARKQRARRGPARGARRRRCRRRARRVSVCLARRPRRAPPGAAGHRQAGRSHGQARGCAPPACARTAHPDALWEAAAAQTSTNQGTEERNTDGSTLRALLNASSLDEDAAPNKREGGGGGGGGEGEERRSPAAHRPIEVRAGAHTHALARRLTRESGFRISGTQRAQRGTRTCASRTAAPCASRTAPAAPRDP